MDRADDRTYMRRMCSFALAAALSIPAIADKFPLTSTSTAPAATGDVDVDKDANGNTKIDLKVEHLARPSELGPTRSTYVVWIQPPGSPPEKLGQLRVNNDLKGELKAATPLRTFDLFVTPEDSGSVPAPSGPVVLRTTIQRRD